MTRLLGISADKEMEQQQQQEGMIEYERNERVHTVKRPQM